MSKSIALVSLGCDKNRVDAERMTYTLEQAGYTVGSDPASADCAIINTCGFIDAAKEEAIAAIFDAVREKEAGRLRAVVVTGCLAQRYCSELAAEIPEIDAIAGLDRNGDIVATVEQALRGQGVRAAGDSAGLPMEGRRSLSTPGHFAYIKIAEGCDRHCTYCAIPAIRGRYRSRRPEAVLAEARELAQSGVKELILIAQDTTSYGEDLPEPCDLAWLLYQLHDIEGFWRIRVLYGYPDKISDRLLTAFRELPRLCKYLDIPLQHACDPVLRRMGRIGTRADIERVLGALRATAEPFAVRSTFIAGFPGETEAQCTELCRFIRAQGFARSGCFAFSPEEGTPAVRLRPRHGDAVKNRRAELVSRACYEAAVDFQLSRIGTVEEAICDGYDPARRICLFRSDFDAPDIDTLILVPVSQPIEAGAVRRVRITALEEPDVRGELVENAADRVYND